MANAWLTGNFSLHHSCSASSPPAPESPLPVPDSTARLGLSQPRPFPWSDFGYSLDSWTFVHPCCIVDERTGIVPWKWRDLLSCQLSTSGLRISQVDYVANVLAKKLILTASMSGVLMCYHILVTLNRKLPLQGKRGTLYERSSPLLPPRVLWILFSSPFSHFSCSLLI